MLKKTNQAWIWVALCRKTRPVVAYASREIEVKRPAAVCGKLFVTYLPIEWGGFYAVSRVGRVPPESCL